MSVLFEFRVDKQFHFASEFGRHFDMQTVDDCVKIPDDLGSGYIREIYLSNGLSLCLHDYFLKQDFILRRMNDVAPNLITIKFDRRRNQAGLPEDSPGYGDRSDVEFGSSDHFSELLLPEGKKINFLVVTTTREILLTMLHMDEQHRSLQKLLLDKSSFLLHENLTADMDRVLKQISQVNEKNELAGLLYQTRAQELIYLLLSRIMNRAETPFSAAINKTDAERIYAVREALLADLAKTPRLNDLASVAGMSTTKLKLLFRQIFGLSIYSYYQAAKMNAGSFLLKTHSVSETGYRLGFTNLSHFTRVFERHFGVKPKRYKDSLIQD